MAIKISGTTVIDDSRNYTGITSVSTGIAGTQTWNSGQSTINIDGTTGNIKIDGILKAGQIIFPLA
jgi:predicted deacylase